MPRRRGEGGGLDPGSVPAGVCGEHREGGREALLQRRRQWLAFVGGQPRRPPPPFRSFASLRRGRLLPC